MRSVGRLRDEQVQPTGLISDDRRPKAAQLRLHDGKYQCVLCGALLEIPPDKEPSVVIKAASGSPNLRTIICDGEEIHSCEMTTPRPG
jgi:hypothetical protein